MKTLALLLSLLSLSLPLVGRTASRDIGLRQVRTLFDRRMAERAAADTLPKGVFYLREITPLWEHAAADEDSLNRYLRIPVQASNGFRLWQDDYQGEWSWAPVRSGLLAVEEKATGRTELYLAFCLPDPDSRPAQGEPRPASEQPPHQPPAPMPPAGYDGLTVWSDFSGYVVRCAEFRQGHLRRQIDFRRTPLSPLRRHEALRQLLDGKVLQYGTDPASGAGDADPRTTVRSKQWETGSWFYIDSGRLWLVAGHPVRFQPGGPLIDTDTIGLLHDTRYAFGESVGEPASLLSAAGSRECLGEGVRNPASDAATSRSDAPQEPGDIRRGAGQYVFTPRNAPQLTADRAQALFERQSAEQTAADTSTRGPFFFKDIAPDWERYRETGLPSSIPVRTANSLRLSYRRDDTGSREEADIRPFLAVRTDRRTGETSFYLRLFIPAPDADAPGLCDTTDFTASFPPERFTGLLLCTDLSGYVQQVWGVLPGRITRILSAESESARPELERLFAGKAILYGLNTPSGTEWNTDLQIVLDDSGRFRLAAGPDGRPAPAADTLTRLDGTRYAVGSSIFRPRCPKPREPQYHFGCSACGPMPYGWKFIFRPRRPEAM